MKSRYWIIVCAVFLIAGGTLVVANAGSDATPTASVTAATAATASAAATTGDATGDVSAGEIAADEQIDDSGCQAEDDSAAPSAEAASCIACTPGQPPRCPRCGFGCAGVCNGSCCECVCP